MATNQKVGSSNLSGRAISPFSAVIAFQLGKVQRIGNRGGTSSPPPEPGYGDAAADNIVTPVTSYNVATFLRLGCEPNGHYQIVQPRI